VPCEVKVAPLKKPKNTPVKKGTGKKVPARR